MTNNQTLQTLINAKIEELEAKFADMLNFIETQTGVSERINLQSFFREALEQAARATADAVKAEQNWISRFGEIKKPMSPNFKKILIKMFQMVDADYTDEFVKSPDWYHAHEWTQKEEDDFARWLAKFLIKNWQGILERRPYVKMAQKASREFCCNYGWKIKEVCEK